MSSLDDFNTYNRLVEAGIASPLFFEETLEARSKLHSSYWKILDTDSAMAYCYFFFKISSALKSEGDSKVEVNRVIEEALSCPAMSETAQQQLAFTYSDYDASIMWNYEWLDIENILYLTQSPSFKAIHIPAILKNPHSNQLIEAVINRIEDDNESSQALIATAAKRLDVNALYRVLEILRQKDIPAIPLLRKLGDYHGVAEEVPDSWLNHMFSTQNT